MNTEISVRSESVVAFFGTIDVHGSRLPPG